MTLENCLTSHPPSSIFFKKEGIFTGSSPVTALYAEIVLRSHVSTKTLLESGSPGSKNTKVEEKLKSDLW